MNCGPPPPRPKEKEKEKDQCTVESRDEDHVDKGCSQPPWSKVLFVGDDFSSKNMKDFLGGKFD